MEQNERQLIDGLFAKLKQAQQQPGPRDPEAEQVIVDALKSQPAAPYYMAQVILVQDHAMQAQYQRIQDLEKKLAERPADGGCFRGGFFGGGSGQSVTTVLPAAERTQPAPAGRGWSNPSPAADERVPVMPPGTQYAAAPAPARGLFGSALGGGGGFMASALTTAAGVAGGMMAANALSSLFGGSQAHAAGLPGGDLAAQTAAAEAQTAAAQAQAAAAQAQAAAAQANATVAQQRDDDVQPDDAQSDNDYSDPGDLLAGNDDGGFDTFGNF